MAHRSADELEAERLMIEAAQRDRAAFAPLYERYVDQIYAYAHTLTRNRELAEDVTASTFAKAIEDLPRFEWRGVPYSAWLYRVAANLVARQARRPAWVDIDAHQPVDERVAGAHRRATRPRGDRARGGGQRFPTTSARRCCCASGATCATARSARSWDAARER